MNRLWRLVVLWVMIGPLAFFACGKKEISDHEIEQEPAATEELYMLCGSSFSPPADELIERFEQETVIKIHKSVAGSEDFLPLVKTGGKGDILVTHDPFLDYVKEADRYADHVHAGFVAPILAVQSGNPKGLTCIEDLAQPGLKVALSNPEYSTCGEMVSDLLEAKGIKDAVMKNVETRLTKGHGRLGTFLKTGVVDAVVMWNGVANTFKDNLDIVRTPYEYDAEIRVHVIGMNRSGNPAALKKFMDFVEIHGRTTFEKHGYIK